MALVTEAINYAAPGRSRRSAKPAVLPDSAEASHLRLTGFAASTALLQAISFLPSATVVGRHGGAGQNNVCCSGRPGAGSSVVGSFAPRRRGDLLRLAG